MSREIVLSKGFVAVVDDEDYEFLNQWKWHVVVKDDRPYAERTKRYGPRLENKKEHIKMHRIIVGVSDPDIKVDHKDGDTLNNTRLNLRSCTNAENSRNSKARNAYKGIKKNSNCSTWSARITVNGEEIYLGSFRTQSAAAAAYDVAAKKYFGDFARLNGVNNE